MRFRTLGPILAAFAVMLAACGTSPASTGPSAAASMASVVASGSDEPSATQAASPAPPDLGEPTEELVGEWVATEGRSWTVELMSDGTFALRADGELDAIGSWGVAGDEIAFADEQWGPAGGPCGPDPSAPYRYAWQLEGDVLSFRILDEAGCADRWPTGSATWVR